MTEIEKELFDKYGVEKDRFYCPKYTGENGTCGTEAYLKQILLSKIKGE